LGARKKGIFPGGDSVKTCWGSGARPVWGLKGGNLTKRKDLNYTGTSLSGGSSSGLQRPKKQGENWQVGGVRFLTVGRAPQGRNFFSVGVHRHREREARIVT